MVGKKRVDLVNVAKSQKLLLIGLLISIIAYVLVLFASSLPVVGRAVATISGAILYLGGLITVLIGMFRLSRAVGSNTIMAILAAIALFVPFVGVLIMLLENRRATKALKASGVKVGFLGVSGKEMQKLVEGVCAKCGYDMRSLPGRACPECASVS